MLRQFRPTWLEIHLKNIWKNYQIISERTNAVVVPVVKADAYGHGAFEVTRYLYERGVDFFAVSSLEEALELRRIGTDFDILIMGLIPKEGLIKAYEHNIIVTIATDDDLQAIRSMATPPRFHMKIDTGMNRLGFKAFDLVKQTIAELMNSKEYQLEGIYTHLATADSDYDYAHKQIQAFKHLLDSIEHPPKEIHISNSSASLKWNEQTLFSTLVRVGVSLYGETLEDDVDFLEQTMTLKARITDIKTLKPGEKLGYDITYEATENTRIGILQIGYADGFKRMNQGGYVSLNGQKREIVGRVCMDQLFIKIGENDKKNDIVVLLGDNIIKVDDIAKRLETIPHEVLTSFGKRVPRVYKI